MKLEVLIYKMSHGWNNEKTLVDHFCIFDQSHKRATRGRIKKLLARLNILGSRYWFFVNKDERGHYHAMKSGGTAKSTYHFFWYYIEMIPCQENTKTLVSATTATDTLLTGVETPNTNEMLQETGRSVPSVAGT